MCNREGGWIQPTLDQIPALFSILFDLSHLSFLHLLRRVRKNSLHVYLWINGARVFESSSPVVGTL